MKRDLYPAERQMLKVVSDASNELYDRKEWSGRVWTKTVQESLATLGRASGFRAFFSGEEDNSAWLWDLTWLDVEENWERFQGVYLACETEWSDQLGEHLRDFMKLVVAESKYRLFVCQVKDAEAWTSERFQALIDASAEVIGKRFLVIGVPPTKPKGAYPHVAWTT